MDKSEILARPFIPLLLWSYGVHGTLFLQLGDKCQIEEKTSTRIFPNYDDLSSNTSSTNHGMEDFSASEISNAICDPTIPFVCLAGRCQSKKGYTINRNGTRCLEVARNALQSECEENIQCWKSSLGRLSECNVNGKCQCFESESLPIVYHQGKCYYGESLGEFCQIDGLCEATSQNARCKDGTCQCKDRYLPSWDKSRCIPISIGLNDTCEENIQCESGTLGALSECNQESMKCECFSSENMNTVFHGGKCYLEAALGDVSQVSAQCQKKTLNSVCVDGKCLCDDGWTISNGNNTLCLPIPSSDGAVVTTTAVLTGPDTIISGGSGSSNGNSNIYNNNNVNGECAQDSQCFHLLGPYSRCNIIKHKCECFISENVHLRLAHYHHHHQTSDMLTVPTDNSVSTSKYEQEQVDWLDYIPNIVMIGSKCYLSRYLGQLCKFNKQCSAVTENSWCDNGRCECLSETHVRSEDGRKCLKIAQKGLDSVCEESAQCTKCELGPLSRCNVEKKRCECSNNVLPVVYYRGKCYFHRQLGSSCESNVECQAGSNYLAECYLGRCRCQNGTVRLTPHVCGFNSTASSIACKSIELSAYVAFLYSGIMFLTASLIFLQNVYFKCSW